MVIVVVVDEEVFEMVDDDSQNAKLKNFYSLIFIIKYLLIYQFEITQRSKDLAIEN